MKKLFTGLFLFGFSVLLLNVTKAEVTEVAQLPANCIAATDGCNSCAREIGGQWACTLKACLDQTDPVYTCTAYATGEVEENPVVCTMQYDPVCGVDGKTYGNACSAGGAKVEIDYKGECIADQAPTKACTADYNPVCGEVQVQCIKAPCYPVQQTFGNQCALEANNAKLLYVGECVQGVDANTNLKAGEGYAYRSIVSLLDQSYLAWKYTPIQAYNYTQGLIDKIDDTLETSRLKKISYNKYQQLKKFLSIYMNLIQK